MKNKIHPAIVTKNNVARFKAQLKSLGLSFDWDGEINATDPDYFKWDAVDIPQAVQGGTCVREGNERQLVYLL